MRGIGERRGSTAETAANLKRRAIDATAIKTRSEGMAVDPN
jgi:hypothetical protein